MFDFQAHETLRKFRRCVMLGGRVREVAACSLLQINARPVAHRAVV